MSQSPNASQDPIEQRRDLGHFLQTLQSGAPSLTRRDLARISALAAGAAATFRYGVSPAVAAGPATRGQSPSGQAGDPQADQELLIPFDPYGEEIVLDPHQAVNWGPLWIMLPNVYGGLLRYKETGDVEYDLAESYEVSDDGRTFTFRLRSDAKYASGNTVKAGDFVDSWKRALNPDALSPMADFMSLIDGYQDYITRKSEDIGISAPDDQTVEVKLSDSFNYFPSYCASFVYAVVDPAVLKDNPDDFYLHDAGTGPWRVTSFKAGGDLVMEPNTNYYGGTSPSLSKLTWRTTSGNDAPKAALDMYTNDDAISADVTISVVDSVTNDDTLKADLQTVKDSGSTISLAMDFAQPPFDKVAVRRAFAQATDRDAFCKNIYKSTFTPTTSFTPPVTETIAKYQAPKGIDFNADDAKKTLSDAGIDDPSSLPDITYFQSSNDPKDEIDRIAAFLKTYQDSLGVSITHDTSMTSDQLALQRQDNNGTQFTLMQWSAIGNTPYILSYALRPDSPFMEGYFNWSENLADQGDDTPGADAKQFDDLTKKADREQDQDARNEQYNQAEKLALMNAVYVPIGNWVQQYVQKPWLQGTRQGAWTGRLPVLFDQNVVVIGRK